MTIALVLVVVAVVLVAVWLLRGRRKAGSAIVLYGPSASGKTALFFRLKRVWLSLPLVGAGLVATSFRFVLLCPICAGCVVTSFRFVLRIARHPMLNSVV